VTRYELRAGFLKEPGPELLPSWSGADFPPIPGCCRRTVFVNGKNSRPP